MRITAERDKYWWSLREYRSEVVMSVGGEGGWWCLAVDRCYGFCICGP